MKAYQAEPCASKFYRIFTFLSLSFSRFYCSQDKKPPALLYEYIFNLAVQANLSPNNEWNITLTLRSCLKGMPDFFEECNRYLEILDNYFYYKLKGKLPILLF